MYMYSCHRLYLTCSGNRIEFDEKTVLMISTNLQLNVALETPTMMQEITNLLMKFDIICIGQISYCVPAKKLHSGEHLLNCRGEV